MSVPCDKGPVLDRIEDKVDKLAQLITDVAVQRSDLDHLYESVRLLGKRVEAIEKQPGKILSIIGSGVFGAILAWIGFELRK